MHLLAIDAQLETEKVSRNDREGIPRQRNRRTKQTSGRPTPAGKTICVVWPAWAPCCFCCTCRSFDEHRSGNGDGPHRRGGTSDVTPNQTSATRGKNDANDPGADQGRLKAAYNFAAKVGTLTAGMIVGKSAWSHRCGGWQTGWKSSACPSTRSDLHKTAINVEVLCLSS
jgi:hypothetical protein